MTAGPAPLQARAPWAADPLHTRGRRFAEAAAQGRDAFQRDRDRIVHCGAFRRLEYKTQVFVNHEGDLFRTRLTHCLKQPEENQPLFQFTEDCLLHLDQASPGITANLSLFFALHLTHFFGVSPRIVETQEGALYFDLIDSLITTTPPLHENYLEGKMASICAELLKTRQPEELEEIKMNQEMRRQLLQNMEYYFLNHVQDFRPLKSLSVLSAVLQ